MNGLQDDSSKKHEVIGEGTYGCVLKPSLPCKNQRVAPKHKLSKVMLKKHAIDEYNEMKKIASIPGIDEYIIPMPELCEPVINKTFLRNTAKCENKKLRSHDPRDFRMLIVEDGGIALDHFNRNILPTLSDIDKSIFFTKIFHLLKSLEFFNKNGIIHHDIKQDNVVYNMETGNIRFIDFGLMKTRKAMIQTSMINMNNEAVTFHNFPPEYKCANIDDYVNDDGCSIKMGYTAYLERLVNTFDSYSFGKMMTKFLEASKNELRFMTEPGYNSVYEFFNTLREEDISKRTYTIEDLPQQYKRILERYKIWKDDIAPSPSKSSIDKYKKWKKTYNLSKQDKNSLLGALKKRRQCRHGFKRDRVTKKCVRKCKDGHIRDKQTRRCRKKT
jgi:serine/threonine protein kinase